jgi:hypothetical protein
MGLETFYKAMWFTLRGISLLSGGMSLVALYARFFVPEFGALAFMSLLAATIIVLGLPPLERQPSGRPPKVSRWPSIIRRLSELARR